MLLDDAGLSDTVVMASNDLDEHRIDRLIADGATIVAWGVGTRLATCSDQPSLGGVYKLAAVNEDGAWQPRIKLSETRAKISIPMLAQGNASIRSAKICTR